MAGPAVDFEPIVDRIYEVLCEGRGAFRTLALDQRFSAKLLSSDGDQARAKNARVQKLCLVAIDSFRDSARTQEMSDRAEYEVAIRVDLAYHTANKYSRAAVIDQMTRAKSDGHRVRMALGWPANLDTTEDLRAVGLGGLGCLRFVSMDAGRLSDDAQLYTVTLAFTATMWLAMPVT